jgi:hypothetical protein
VVHGLGSGLRDLLAVDCSCTRAGVCFYRSESKEARE